MTDMDHIIDFLRAMEAPDMAAQVANAAHRLEAFASGLDQDIKQILSGNIQQIHAELEAARAAALNEGIRAGEFERLAAERLEQMQADRAQALRWRDRVGQLEGQLDSQRRQTEQAKAQADALAREMAANGEVVVTRNEDGAIVAVTRQDEEWRILSVLAEAPAEAVKPIADFNLFTTKPAVFGVFGSPSDIALTAIGHLIDTQDNWATDAPLFVVFQKRAIVVDEDYDYSRIVWVEDDSGDNVEATDVQRAALEAGYQSSLFIPDGWRRLAVKDIDVFVTACFTEQGCKDYLARDGHNLREPFIYAAGTYRNQEMRTIRDALMKLAGDDGEN